MLRIRFHHGIFSLALMVFASLGTTTAIAQKNAKKTAPSQDNARMVSLEVTALQTLRNLDPSTTQLQELLRLSKNSAQSAKGQGQTRVTPALMKTLTGLRNALLADDGDRISELRKKLQEIMDKDDIDLDDHVTISDSARRNAVQMVRLLKPSQVLSYLEILDADEIDPGELLHDALDRGKSMNPAEWKQFREQAAADAAWLIAGNEESKSSPIAKRIATLLDQQRTGKLSRTELDKQVQQWTASLDPFEILRHAMQREMAELLSNPCLPQAVQHTLEQRRKVAAR